MKTRFSSMSFLSLLVMAGLLASSAAALAQDRNQEQRPRQPGLDCATLAGESKKQCLREERVAKRDSRDARRLGGSCDDLLGPEKERCLKQGGTIEAGATSSMQERSSTGR